MKIVFFEWQNFEQIVSQKYNVDFGKDTEFLPVLFDINIAKGSDIISIFVDSKISNQDLDILKNSGCKSILLRCAGFNMLDIQYAKNIGISVYRVASYSPESIAEFVFALILNLARKMNLERKKHESLKNGRTIDSMGFVLRGKTLGLHGYGKIGKVVADIARDGFKMNVIFFDPFISTPQKDMKVNSLKELYSSSDIVSIHMPLNEQTKNSVNRNILQNLKNNFILINTSRGQIVNSEDLVEALKNKDVDYFGTDVWGESDSFDSNLLINNAFQADHVAFFTEEAVLSILEQTKESITNARIENRL